MPFMLAQIHAKPWAYMTSYSRVNGVHVSENYYLLQRLLRGEWGFDGICVVGTVHIWLTSERLVRYILHFRVYQSWRRPRNARRVHVERSSCQICTHRWQAQHGGH